MNNQENPNFNLSRRKFLKTLAVISGTLLGLEQNGVSHRIWAQGLEPTEEPTEQPPVEGDPNTEEQAPVEADYRINLEQGSVAFEQLPPALQEVAQSGPFALWENGTPIVTNQGPATKFHEAHPSETDFLNHPDPKYLYGVRDLVMPDLIEQMQMDPDGKVFILSSSGELIERTFTTQDFPFISVTWYNQGQYAIDKEQFVLSGGNEADLINKNVVQTGEDDRFHILRYYNETTGIYEARIYMPADTDPYSTQDLLFTWALFHFVSDNEFENKFYGVNSPGGDYRALHVTSNALHKLGYPGY